MIASKHTIALAASAVAGAVLLAGVGCGRSATVQAVSAAPADPVSVAVVKAARQDLARTLTLSAEFKPYQEIDVMAKVSGYVKTILVDVGDRVRQGQLLAELEVPEMADDISRADAAIERNTAEYGRARDELRRAESAHQIAHLSYERLAAVLKNRPGLVAQQEVDDARGRDLVAEAQVSAAASSLAAAQQQVRVSQAERNKSGTLFSYSRVVAPFAGVITKRFADTGSMIQAGTASQIQARPLVTLSENDLLRLILPVPESAVPAVHLGEPVEVRVPTLGRGFPGRVARFANSVQPATRTMETEVDVPNPRLVLVPGMFAEALLTLDQRKNALSIPIAAVADPEGTPWVFVVTGDSLLERREISLGVESADRAEVLTGLKENEVVVIGNRAQLKPGQQVVPTMAVMTASGAGR